PAGTGSVPCHLIRRRPGRPACQQIAAQRHGVVVLGVVGAVEQRDVVGREGVEQRPPRLGVLVELADVAALELLPALGVVAEPLAQLVAGPDLGQPGLHPELVPAHTARPEPFDEEPASRPVGLPVVHPGQSYLAHFSLHAPLVLRPSADDGRPAGAAPSRPTTTTGPCARRTSVLLTEPSNLLRTGPRPREPTTTSAAPTDSAINAAAGSPGSSFGSTGTSANRLPQYSSSLSRADRAEASVAAGRSQAP